MGMGVGMVSADARLSPRGCGVYTINYPRYRVQDVLPGLKYCHLTKSNTRLIFYDDCSSRVRDSASIYLNGDNTARSSKSEEYVFCWPHHFLLGHPEVSIIGVLCEVTQFIFDHVIGKCPNPRTTVNAVRQHISFRYIIHNK